MGALEELLARVKQLPKEDRAVLDTDVLSSTADLPWVPNVGPQLECFFSEADEIFYGGQAGGGKTDLSIGLAITEHNRSLLLRRINRDAVKLVERVSDIIGHRDGYNGQLQRWKLGDKLIEFGGCEMESDKQRYKGDPHDLICFDEGSDFLESQYRFIIGWNRSAVPGQRCRILVTSNPPTAAAGFWVVRYWGPWLDKTHPNPANPGELRWYTTVDGADAEVDGPGPHLVNGEEVMAKSRTFIRATLADNPFLDKKTIVLADGTSKVVPGDYHARLAALPEELRRAYRDGDFSVGQKDDDFQVIPTAWIEAAQQRWNEVPPVRMKMTAMAVDVAPGGGDQRVICWRYAGWFAPFIAEKQVDRTGRLTASEVVKHRLDRCPVVVDLGGGWGGDALIALKNNISENEVYAFNGVVSSTARTRDGKLKFVNRRAESIWRMREELDPSQEGGSPIALPPDSELKADLASYRWTLGTNGILIEAKEKAKERLGRSPDKGDAAVMCLTEGERAMERMLRAEKSGGQMMANVGGRQFATVRK